MFLIYSFLYAVAIIFLFLPQYFKRPSGLRGKWLREKMGYTPETGSAIWIHAVSVGEVNASLPLQKRLRTAYPSSPIVISTITDTGQEVAARNAPEGTTVVYLPFDMPFILRRCLKRTRPKIFITIETEFWPNAFRVFAEEGVPVLVLNGRISDRSATGYAKVAFFMKKVLRFVALFGMQSDLDAERLRRMGADEKKVAVIGNFKFDRITPSVRPGWAGEFEGPVIVAGSTHPGEEEIILSSYLENLVRFPKLRLILAPRHPERFKEVEEMLRVKAVPFVTRTDLDKGPSTLGLSEKGVMLLDSMGELAAAYGIADIAIIGKSFTGFGGQSPLEPAFWGKAIICGPHMENFPFIQDFYQEGAAFKVEVPDLPKKIRELLVSPEKARSAGAKAKEMYNRNSGAVDRAMKIIGEYV